MSLNIMLTPKQTSKTSAGFRYRIAEIAINQQKQRCKIDLAQMIILKIVESGQFGGDDSGQIMRLIMRLINMSS